MRPFRAASARLLSLHDKANMAGQPAIVMSFLFEGSSRWYFHTTLIHLERPHTPLITHCLIGSLVADAFYCFATEERFMASRPL